MPACSGSTAATSSMPGASMTARHTVEPMRPPAPNTPTRIMGAGYRRAAARPTGNGPSGRCSEVAFVVRADHRERPARVGEHPLDHPAGVVGGDRSDARDQLVECRDLALDELRATEAAHAAGRRLE